MSGSTPPIKPQNSSEPIQEFDDIGEMGAHKFQDLTGREHDLSNKVQPQNLYSKRPLEHQVSPPDDGGIWSIFGLLLAKIFSIFSQFFSFSSPQKTTAPVDRESGIEEFGGFDKKELKSHEADHHINSWQAQIDGYNQLPPDQRFPNLLRVYDTLEKEIPPLTYSQEQMERMDTMRQNLKNELDRHLLDMKLKLEGQKEKEEMFGPQSNAFQEAPVREKLQLLQEEHQNKEEQAKTLIAAKKKQIEAQEKKIQNLEIKKEGVKTKIQEQASKQKEDLSQRAEVMAKEMFEKRQLFEPLILQLRAEIVEKTKQKEELLEILEGKKTNWFGKKIDFTSANEGQLTRINQRLVGLEQEVNEFNSLPSTLKEASDKARQQINEEYQKEYQILSRQIDDHTIEIGVAKEILNRFTTEKNDAEEAKRQLEIISQELQQLTQALQ